MCVYIALSVNSVNSVKCFPFNINGLWSIYSQKLPYINSVKSVIVSANPAPPKNRSSREKRSGRVKSGVPEGIA